MATSSAAQEVDKEFLYGRHDAAEDKRQKFIRRLAHKAVDLPLEDDVKVDNSRIGIGAWGAMGIATAAGLPGLAAAAILGWAMLHKGEVGPEAAAPTMTASPTDSEYEVRFFDHNGNPIDVPRYQGATKQ